MKIIIGNSGLVGNTLKEKINFDLEFNSKNINEFESQVNDGCDLYLSCLPATKWLVNKDVKKDYDNINDIVNIISKKTYNNVFLISTIDVYTDSPLKSNEDYKPNFSNLNYGNNRYLFELLVKNFVKTNNLKIFRLPALFSKDIKKNVLFDLLNNNNVENIILNSTYQWYDLKNLVSDIDYFTKSYPDETIFNLFTEPLETKEIIKLFSHVSANDVKQNGEIIYDYTTKFGTYILNKEMVLNQIKTLIDEISSK
jgi:nucleoside-diphosphate-sugar epimerase